MKPVVIIENNIPFIRGLLESAADVIYLDPAEINNRSMRDADALITRTRTRCDASLLDGSRCRFIATATIGTDHIDLDYCRRNGITVANAPGCNAPAVAQYVFASIAAVRGMSTDGVTLGVVGAGHVGSIVIDWARKLGMRTLVCDPPRADSEGAGDFVSIDVIASESDIITFHTPMTRGGAYPTFHLLDRRLVESFKKKPMVINSARGPVTDTESLLYGLDSGLISNVAVDCWENEPAISPLLLDKASVATPHVAGYSREGKIRATRMAVDQFTRHFGLPPVKMTESVPDGACRDVTFPMIADSYNPLVDTAMLKRNPGDFERLRNSYNYRHEVGVNVI